MVWRVKRETHIMDTLQGLPCWKFVRRHWNRGICRCYVIAISLALLLCLVVSNIYTPKINHHDNENSKLPKQKVDLANLVVSSLVSPSQSTPIFLTVLQNNSMPLIFNWLCHVRDYVSYKNIIVVAMTNSQRDIIRTFHPEIQTFSVESEPDFNDDEERLSSAKICELKIEIILQLMKRNINVIVFRVDSIWIQNPLIPIQKILKNDKSIDILTTTFSGRPSALDSGMFFIKATAESITFISEYLSKVRSMIHRLTDKKHFIVDKKEYCYGYFTYLVHRHFGKIHFKILPLNSFVDVKWYEQKGSIAPGENLENFRQIFVVRVYNHFEDDNTPNKMALMESWNLWFLDDNHMCAYDRIDLMEKKVLGLR